MKELAHKIGVTEKGIEWQINELKQWGHIKRVGLDKGGYWEIQSNRCFIFRLIPTFNGFSWVSKTPFIILSFI